MDSIYLRAGRVRLRGWGSRPISFSCHGGLWGWGVQNKFEQKIGGGGVKANFYFFSITSARITFFKCENKAGKGDDPGQFKKFRQGGHMGGFNKYFF